MKKWIALLIVLLLLAGGYAWKNRENPNTAGLPDSPTPLKTTQDSLGKKPVLLEFTSTSCTYCDQLKPIVQELHKQYGDRIEFIIANTDQNQEAQSMAYFYKIRGVPTIVIHGRDGKISTTFIGFTAKEKLANALEQVLK